MCKAHAEAERSLARELEGRPFEIVFVDADTELAVALRAVSALRLPGTQLWAGPEGTDGPLPASLRVASWPLFLLVDGDGVVRWRSHRFDGLREVVLRCVARAETAATSGRAR